MKLALADVKEISEFVVWIAGGFWIAYVSVRRYVKRMFARFIHKQIDAMKISETLSSIQEQTSLISANVNSLSQNVASLSKNLEAVKIDVAYLKGRTE